MLRGSRRALPLIAVPLLVVALAAAFQLLERRSWGGGLRAPSVRAGRPWHVDQARAFLAIDRKGVHYFDRTPVRTEALPAVLDSAFRRLPPGTPLHVYADRTLAAGVVEHAVRVARAAGFRQVSLIAEPADTL